MTNPLIEILRRNAEGYINQTTLTLPLPLCHAAPLIMPHALRMLTLNSALRMLAYRAPVYARPPLSARPRSRYNKIRPLDESARNSVTPLLSSTRDEEEEEEQGGGDAHI